MKRSMPVLGSVLGLDLGSHSLKVVELQQTLRGIEVVQQRTLPRGAGDAELPEQLQHLLRLHRLGTEHVVAALPGDCLSARRLHFPFRDRRKLAQAVPFAVEGDLPFELEQVVVDWEIAESDRSHAEVIATIAPRAEVARLLGLLDAAGCSPRTLEGEGLVLGNLASIFDLPAVRILADVGHRKTTFCLIADGRPVGARTTRIGGLHLTQALAKERDLSLERAEQIKCGEGVLRHGAAGPEVTAVLDRLARELMLFQGAHQELVARLGSGRVASIALFGGSAQLPDLDRFLADRTGIPTARLGFPREGAGSGFVAAGPPILFAPAIALALRGTAQARTRTNFRQHEFAQRIDLDRLRREFRWTGWLAAACAGFGLLSFGLDAGLTARRASALERATEALYAGAFAGQPTPGNPLSALREQVQSANDRAAFLGVYRGNLSALDLLSEISRLVPKELDVVFEELTIDRQTVRLRAYARSFEAAERLGAELGKFPAFSAVRIGAIESDPKTQAKRFNVTISMGEESA